MTAALGTALGTALGADPAAAADITVTATGSGPAVTLQVALDRIPLDRALAVTAGAAAAGADWIEVGTSLIKRYGMAGLTEVVAAAGAVPVLADLKTADDARTELAMAYGAGARSATVLGLAAPATLAAAAATAAEYRAELMVDLMELDAAGRTRVAAAVPPEAVLSAHVPKDAQTGGADPLALLGRWTTGRRLAVAGGLGLTDLPRLASVATSVRELRLIVGSAVTGRPDPAAATAAFRAALPHPPTDHSATDHSATGHSATDHAATDRTTT